MRSTRPHRPSARAENHARRGLKRTHTDTTPEIEQLDVPPCASRRRPRALSQQRQSAANASAATTRTCPSGSPQSITATLPLRTRTSARRRRPVLNPLAALAGRVPGSPAEATAAPRFAQCASQPASMMRIATSVYETPRPGRPTDWASETPTLSTPPRQKQDSRSG
jgi:hypothetical protein